MPTKKSNSRKRNSAPKSRKTTETRVKTEQEMLRDREILSITLITLAVLFLVNFIIAPDPTEADISNVGILSMWINKILRFFAGAGAIVVPVFLLGYGVVVFVNKHNESVRGRFIGLLLVFLAFLTFLNLGEPLDTFSQYISVGAAGGGGGVIGSLLAFCFLKTIGKVGTGIVFSALALIGMLLFLQTSLGNLFGSVKKGSNKAKELLAYQHQMVEPEEDSEPAPVEMPTISRHIPVINHDELLSGEEEALPGFVQDDSILTTATAVVETKAVPVEPEPPQAPQPQETAFMREFMPSISGKKQEAVFPAMDITSREEPVFQAEPVEEQTVFEVTDPVEEADDMFDPVAEEEPVVEAPADDSFDPAQNEQTEESGYQLPPVELIEMGVKVRNPRMNKLITDSVATLESTLDSFGVKATVTQVVSGPAVTRYELQTAPGIKVSRVTGLSDDIALALAAQSVRIEAPIPGKSAIGIEVARKEIDTVYFREMIESANFKDSSAKLSFVLGKDITGEAIVGNLAKMPHLLIAGATGSGKSICINCLICSLLYKAKPNEVKLMLIDPKKVELMQYAQLPHLIAPVVNDCKKAANALKWVVNEMDARYTLFVGASVRDFDGYNAIHKEDPLPYIVVIIDELADLMLVARHDVEDSICRLAQLARAAGIHLVVATQRPSVDIITGTIKNNIPSRVAFAVSSNTDSRTILGVGGAEKLLGRGDMLYDPMGATKPMRIQGSYIDAADVSRLVEYCSNQANPSFSETAVQASSTSGKMSFESPSEPKDDLDELFYDAGSLIISNGQASTSFLQRRLAIGNPRAARIMDMLEQKGVVGGHNGAKPRDILMTLDEFEETFG